MAVRHAVLKGKDAQKIIQDLDEIDDMGGFLWCCKFTFILKRFVRIL